MNVTCTSIRRRVCQDEISSSTNLFNVEIGIEQISITSALFSIDGFSDVHKCVIALLHSVCTITNSQDCFLEEKITDFSLIGTDID